MAAVENALVIGGGISGLSTATSLRRRGVETELVEIAPAWKPLGSGITLGGAALRALHGIGNALDRCIEHGFSVYEQRICNTEGARLETIHLPRPLGPEYPGTLGMMRPTLHADLLAETDAAGVPVRLGTTVTALEQPNGRVRVTLSDGAEREFDLVVVADGFRSRFREMMIGLVRPVFREQATYRAVFERFEEVDAAYQFHGHPLVHPGFLPSGENEMYMFLAVPARADENPRREDLPHLVREHMSSFGGLMAEAREQVVDPDRLDFRLLETLIVEPPWHRGRVVLVGDAAHTTTPHGGAGAALGMEDAIVLAEELASHESVEDALQTFSTRRYGRCRFIVESSGQLSAWQAHPGTPGEDPQGLRKSMMAKLAEPF